MKKIVVLLAMLLCVSLLASCTNQSAQPAEEPTVEQSEQETVVDPLMSAVWTGYDKMPFAEFLETAMENLPTELGVIESYDITADFGWPEGMDDIPLEPAEGTVSASYTFVVEASEGGSEVEKGIVEFAVELDETTNTFEIEYIFLNGEVLSYNSEKQGMEMLRLLADGEAHKIYEMETREIAHELVIEE